MDAADFPIICARCLGPNPYLRLQRENGTRQCKICSSAFTVFRWPAPAPGGGQQRLQRGAARHRKTEICKNCALVRNACQSCVLDVNTGISLAVRDLAQSNN